MLEEFIFENTNKEYPFTVKNDNLLKALGNKEKL